MRKRKWPRRVGRARFAKPLAPLRKIVDMRQLVGNIYEELLECGHIIRQPQDIIGPTNAIRRRCRKCLREDPVDRPASTS